MRAEFDASSHSSSEPVAQWDRESLTSVRREDVRGLAQSRGEVGQGEIGRVNLIDEFAVRLRFLLDTLPLGIVLERLPVGSSGIAAGMLKNVDQGIAFLRFIERRPVRDAFNSVAVKDLYGVVAEARLEVGKFSWSRMIDAEFVDGGGGCRIGVVLPGGGPK